MKINTHKFNFNLPMHPQEGGHVLEMDGQPLKGVTGLHVRADSNGFTNATLEFESACAVAFCGHLVAHIGDDHTESHSEYYAGIYKTALAEIQEDLDAEGAELESEMFAQAQLVRRIIELMIETPYTK